MIQVPLGREYITSLYSRLWPHSVYICKEEYNGKNCIINGIGALGRSAWSLTLALLDVPATVAAHGIHTLDLCNQHIPSIETGYLAELRGAFTSAGVEPFQVLIDLGDVPSPDPQVSAAGMAMVKRWIELACELSAGDVRYVPGSNEPSPETMRLASEAFRELADYAVQYGIKPVTKNYKSMNQRAGTLLEIIERADREYGLIADFGNARVPDK